MNCKKCESNNIINENQSYICINCGCLQWYEMTINYVDKYDYITNNNKYYRISYLNYLLNNINHKYINDNDNLNEIYINLYNHIVFNYQENKIYLKKNKHIYGDIWYHNIYFFMYKKYPWKYIFINNSTRYEILNLFEKYEKIFKKYKKNIICLKKKIINYQYILKKIFFSLNLDEIFYNY